MLFKLGARITNDGLRKHLILFRDNVEDDQLLAILLLKRVPNHFSDIHGPILFKLGISKVENSIHLHLTLFCDLIKGG